MCYDTPTNLVLLHTCNILLCTCVCKLLGKLWSSYVISSLLLQLFFQVKGQMCLKVVEKDCHKDIPIAEGEVCIHLLKNFLNVMCALHYNY